MWKIKKIISKGDYDYALVPEHPNCTKNGYVLAHRIIMENHLSRLLNSNEVVHHKNGNKKDNNISNLELMTHSEHSKMHASNGRTMLKLKCPECNKIFSKPKNQSHLVKGGIFSSCSSKCSGKFSRKIQLHGKTPKVEKAISGNIVSEFNSLDNPEETI